MDRIRMLYVICYDVEDDRGREKLAGLLLDFGDRVQKSVFEVEISPEELKELLARASKYVESGDSLLAYPLCRACAGRTERLGRETPEPPGGWVVV